jgi:BirA family biotin operon repressor/biotin-[acetyl-CoA-carboxylase] ligase
MHASDLEDFAERILLRIRKKQNKPVPITALSKDLKISESNVAEGVKVIRSWGYRIKKRRSGDIVFVSAPDSMIATEIGHNLKTKLIGRKIYAFQSVKSTNDLAAQLAEQGEPEGTIVTSEQQTVGRGRLGRKWHSPPKSGIYVSVILRPKFKPELAPGLSVMTALALRDAIHSICPGEVRIKWPNDILIANRKTAGILTELYADKEKIDFVIIGVGINVNMKAEEFPADLRATATSIRRVNKRRADRIQLLQSFLKCLEKEYERYRKDQLAGSLKRIRRHSSLIGTTVELNMGRQTIRGKAVDIDKSGALVVDIDDRQVSVAGGEVTVVKDID